MRTLCHVLTMLVLAGPVLAGCGGVSPGMSKDPASMSAVDQYKAALRAFQGKLGESTGLTLAQLRSQWGQVRQGITRNQSTIYHWVQNISVTPPPETAAKVGLKTAAEPAGQTDRPLSLSCMAIFIFNQSGVVDEAFSEGQCLDHTLMPGWRPVVEPTGNTLGRANT